MRIRHSARPALPSSSSSSAAASNSNSHSTLNDAAEDAAGAMDGGGAVPVTTVPVDDTEAHDLALDEMTPAEAKLRDRVDGFRLNALRVARRIIHFTMPTKLFQLDAIVQVRLRVSAQLGLGTRRVARVGERRAARVGARRATRVGARRVAGSRDRSSLVEL